MIDSPEIKLHKYSYTIFDKSAKEFQWGWNCLFNKWVLEQLPMHMQNKKRKKEKSTHRLHVSHELTQNES